MTIKQSMKEVLKIAAGAFALLLIMWVVFALLGCFSYKVVLGGLLGVFTSSLNFFFLALTLEVSLGSGEKKAQGMMGVSYLLRLLFIAVIVVLAIKSPHINYIAVVIPLIFPRIVITLLNVFKKQKKEDDCERTEGTI